MASLLDALMNYTGTGSPQKGQNSVSNTSTGPRDGWQYGDEDDGIVLQGMSMEEFMKLENLAQQNVSMENVQKNVDDIAARKPVVEEEIQSGVSVEATIVNKGDTDSDSEDDGVNYHSASEYEAELAGAMGQLKVATPETSLGAADLPPPPPPWTPPWMRIHKTRVTHEKRSLHSITFHALLRASNILILT